MPISVSCPKCKKRFSTPDQYAGKKAKCSQCGQIMVVPQPAKASTNDLVTEMLDEEFGPAPQSPKTAASNACPSCKRAVAPGAVLCVNCGYDFRQGKVRQVSRPAPLPQKREIPASTAAQPGRKVRRASDSSRWMRLVRVGLILKFWTLLATYALALLTLVIFVSTAATRSELDQDSAMIITLGMCAIVLGNLLGNVFCLFVPGDSGAKGMIFVVIVVSLLPVIESIVFLFFLKSLARYINQPRMAESAEEVAGAIMLAVSFVGVLVLVVVIPLFLLHIVFPVLVFFLAVVMVPFVLFKLFMALNQYCRLLRDLIKEIKSQCIARR